MKYLTKEAVYLAVPLVLIAVAADYYFAPPMYSSNETGLAPINGDTSLNETAVVGSGDADALLELFAATNPHKKAKAAEAERLAEESEAESISVLREGEQQLASLALRLSGVFEKDSTLHALVRIRDLQSGDESREVLTKGARLGALTVDSVNLERLLLTDDDGERFELVLFKQSAK
ncbi:hypothetical protein [Aliagarivorans taiwanensis]|uniref:hypothetical protein n=1 Tax=Aliagarivorans taiwanensis TaxID=561966 RepID=UPI00047A65E3|nr:hypothetical protein [Aliagarivorans taiwanensis]